MAKRRLPLEGKFDTEAKRGDDLRDQNSAKAGGASLEMGSSEYREYVYDHKGMDEFEQQDAERERSSGFKDDDFHKDDAFHMERANKLANERNERRKEFDADENGRLTTAERKTAWQVRKAAAAKSAEAAAVKRAAATPSKDDDSYVARRLPKVLEDATYDDGVQEDEMDDIYPGMSSINKYL